MIVFSVCNKPFKSLGYPSGRVKSHEGLQKIYPQNLKKKKHKEGNEDKEIKRTKHTIYTHLDKLYIIQ